MRFTSAIIAITLLAPIAPCQDNSDRGLSSQLKHSQLCKVEGTVLNSVTGEPVRKRLVMLSVFGEHRQTRQHSAMTDENGHFVIQDVEPGSYTLVAGGGGIPAQIYGRQFSGHGGKIISLEAGQSEKGIVFKIAPGAVISGMVSDEDGDPIVGASVQAFQAISLSRRRGPVQVAQTNDRGEYRIFGLESGKYVLMAEARTYVQGSPDLYVPTFYPGTPDEAQASPVEVHPGDEASAINLILTEVHGVRVSGRLVTAVALKGANDWVQLISTGPQGRFVHQNFSAEPQDENGDFEIDGVPPGSYLAVAHWNDGKNTLAGSTPVDVSNVDVDNVVVALKAGFDLQGRVSTEQDSKLDMNRLRIWLQPSSPPAPGGEGAEMKADGSFVIRNVFDGNYRIRVAGYPEEFYLKSARVGGQDLLANGGTITSSSAGSVLEIVLSGSGGSIAGTVMHDSRPVPGALVTLVPDPPNRNREDLYESKTTDEFGRFTMLGLPPGNFKIFAWDSPMDVNPRDPEFLKEYEDKGQSVQVDEKHRQTLELESISPDETPQ
jgi:Carboxypeptidase regulatory-like domain